VFDLSQNIKHYGVYYPWSFSRMLVKTVFPSFVSTG